MTPTQLYPGFDLHAPAITASIEPGIKPVCDALNALPSVFTLWSCEGHPEDGSQPYVTFIADTATAFNVHSAIGPDSGKSGLLFCWCLNASFRNDGSMQYTIEPNDYRISKHSWQRWWSRRRWNQRLVETDLSRLGALVAQLKSSY